MNESTMIDGVNAGPLAALLVTREGDKGADRAPEPDGEACDPRCDKTVYGHRDVNSLRSIG